MANSEDSDETTRYLVSSGSTLFVKVPVLVGKDERVNIMQCSIVIKEDIDECIKKRNIRTAKHKGQLSLF